ncbi:MFS transporter [Paenibacillus amylolyticus]|uniref:MFS transporter n=1 Tax=Paenibacillus amylolyticus TaxID=1451 RepID=A0A5M9WPV6_PAEAM|nr:MFS transporter [Paenibacillus amylolyticus]KAA8783615.1 MFS transporter [Paenibacillus amylolyticus]
MKDTESLEIQDTSSTGKETVLLRVLVFTLIISVMNGMMFNVVLPVIGDQFERSASETSWIVTGYLIVYAVGTVTYGKLTDRYSIKHLITFGLLLLAAGSAMGILSTSFFMIILARLIQAAGAAVIPALAMIIPVRYFPPNKRGQALGTSAIGIALGSALGPIVAGFVSSALNWKFLFAIPLLSLLTLPFYRKCLNDEKRVYEKMDYLGGILLAVSIGAILLALTQMNLWYLLLGFVVLALFILRILHAASPFVQPAVFCNRSYTWGMIISFVLVACGFSIPFIIPQLLTHVYDAYPALTGLIMLPSALIAALLGRRGGKLADEKGNVYLIYTASTMLAIGFICLSFVAGVSLFFVSSCLVLAVLGQSYMQIALSNTIAQTLSKEQVGIGMGLLSMFNFIAASVSTTVLGKVIDGGAQQMHFNPFISLSSAFVYSNLFIVLALLVVVMTFVYRWHFDRKSQGQMNESSTLF